jgi:hypothetical protein
MFRSTPSADISGDGHSGSALLQVMVSVFLLSIIALGIASINRYGNKVANNLRLSDEFSSLKSQVEVALGDFKNCPVAMRNPGNQPINYPLNGSGGVKVSKVTSNNGASEILAEKAEYRGFTITSMELQSPPLQGPFVAVTRDAAGTYRTYQKVMTQLKIKAVKDTVQAKGDSNYLGNSEMNVSIPLVLITGPNGGANVYQCMLHDNDYGTMCNALGGKFDWTQTPPCLLSKLGVSDGYPDRNTGVAALPASGSLYSKGNIFTPADGGLGTMVPRSRLDVRGGVAVGNYAGANVAPNNGMIVSGSVGVGNAAPANALSVTGNGDFSGRLGIGTVAPSNSLTVNGTADITGNLGVGTAAPATQVDVPSGKIWMQSRTQDADPLQTVVTKDYALKNLFANKGLCPFRYVLLGFDANGGPICAPTDAIIAKSCPAGYYMVGYDGSGNQICIPLSTRLGACGYRQYLAGVDASGNRICKSLWETNLCAVGDALQGIDASGNPVCTVRFTGGSCPAGTVLVRINPDSSVVCGNQENGGVCPAGQRATGINQNGTPICAGRFGDTVSVQGNTASCDSRGGYPCGDSVAYCPAGYKMTGGGNTWLADYNCSEQFRFVNVSKPEGTTGWRTRMACSTYRAWVRCAR